VAVLAGNTLLRPLVNRISRSPMDERAAEASYEVHVLTQAEHVGEVRDLIAERANYSVRKIETSERSGDVTELAATLVSTAGHPAKMDAVVTALGTFACELVIKRSGPMAKPQPAVGRIPPGHQKRVSRMPVYQKERHYTGRTGWLRAAVLGANDGILSTGRSSSGCRVRAWDAQQHPAGWRCRSCRGSYGDGSGRICVRPLAGRHRKS
jgi:hypothetical protein